jgi:septum formation inhibitor MinC
VQSHVAENHDEIAWVRALYPEARSYLAVYEQFGLLRQRSVYAHCIHFDDTDRALMRASGAAAAISPTSNLFLGSGFFDYEGADRVGFAYGLASDVGGGTSFSPFHTMLAAYYVGREGHSKTGLSIKPQQMWWQDSAGAAKALGLSAAPDAMPARRAEPEIHEIIREVEVEVPAPLADAVIVDRPLRSGQRVYAKGTDIVVLDMVSYGAEVIADGNVHVYAPLRGRAVAGASGNTSARIFSTCMEAQLLSIAGIYRTIETDLPKDVAGKAAKVRLEGERIVIEPV